MTDPFVRRIKDLASLTADQIHAVEGLTGRVRHLGARENLVVDGDDPHIVNIVLSGWACRYKILPDGRRQIISLFLPGDMCDPHVFLLDTTNYALATLTPATVAKVPAQAIRDLMAGGPEIAEALWWQMLVAVEIQREWTVNLGRRTALERLAHLFCEISARLAVVGLSNGSDCEWPLTQTDLADISGLSTVHVNRSLQELRASRLIDLRSRRLTIHDRQGLTDLAMFDPTYLHRRAG